MQLDLVWVAIEIQQATLQSIQYTLGMKLMGSPVLDFRNPGTDFKNNFRARNETVGKWDYPQDQGGREVGRQRLGCPTLGLVRRERAESGQRDPLSTRE